MRLKKKKLFMRLNFLKYASVLIFTVFLFSCDPDDGVEKNSPVLVSASEVNTITKSSFISSLSSVFGSQAASVSFFVNSGIKQVKIVYKTKTPEGQDINASGALILPTDFKEPLALVSYQHGTIFSDADAPSYFRAQSEASVGGFLASTGYIMAMPDYLGYAESKSYPHPYEHAQGLAQPTVDFLLAVKEYLLKEKINWNNNLLLGGYSEGGYATLATHKLIEEKYAKSFNLKATSIGAGAYNKTATVENFLKNKTSGEVVNNRSYIWVVQTYNRLYKINNPLSDLFTEPYLKDINDKGLGVSINVSFDQILNPKFKTSILDKSNTAWVNAIKDNDLIDFKTQVPIKFYHGDKDTYVPFLNSETAVAGLKAKGSTNISLEKVAGGTHSSTVNAFYLGTLDHFNLNKNNK
jgi:fermentation-respiration switch protein FrsA (DUF1100 family)